MNNPDFLRIERDGPDGSKHYVVLIPDPAAPDQIGRGVIRRILVPNSWAGDYTKYSKFIGAAQDFFSRSFEEPVPKSAAHRFLT